MLGRHYGQMTTGLSYFYILWTKYHYQSPTLKSSQMFYWSSKFSDKWRKISKKKENYSWFDSLRNELYGRTRQTWMRKMGSKNVPFWYNCLLIKHMEIKWARLNSLLFITYFMKNCIILHQDKAFLQYAQIFTFTLWTFEPFWHFLQTSEHPFKLNGSLLPFNFFTL